MFESRPGSSDPFSTRPSSYEQRFQSLVGYGREQQSGVAVFEAVGERARRAADFGRGVLSVIQRVDMVGSTQAGLGYAGKAVGVAEKVLDNRAVRFAERVPIVGGHVRAARGVTEMARTVVDTGNQLTNSADVLSQSPQARREVARSAAGRRHETVLRVAWALSAAWMVVGRRFFVVFSKLLLIYFARAAGRVSMRFRKRVERALGRLVHQCLSKVRHVHRRLHLIIRRSCRLSHMSRLGRLSRMVLLIGQKI